MLRGFRCAALLAVILAAGCGDKSKRTSITMYPQWDWESYDRIAVVPFHYAEGQPGAAESARQATFLMEDLLAGNGNFTVLDRTTVTDVLTEQDLSRLADVADPSTALPEGKIMAAQALVVGKIAEVDLKAERIEKRYPVFAKDNKGRVRRGRNGQPIVVREEVRHYFRHQGTVRGSVRVIDVATNKVIHSYTAQPISYDDEQQGAPPSSSPEDLAVEAAKALAVDCYNHIAPINREVKLKSDMLVVALDYYDGEYDKTKKVPTTLDHFLVAVRKLPSECDQNPFRIAIAPEEGRNLWEQEFTWTTNNSVRGQSWEVPVQLLDATGEEKFVVKLYGGNGEEPIIDRDFKLEPPDEDD